MKWKDHEIHHKQSDKARIVCVEYGCPYVDAVSTLVLYYGQTNVAPTQKKQYLLSSNWRLHFQIYKFSWNEQEFGNASWRDRKARTNEPLNYRGPSAIYSYVILYYFMLWSWTVSGQVFGSMYFKLLHQRFPGETEENISECVSLKPTRIRNGYL